MADKKGIDISYFQGSPDFSKLKSEVDFIILRAGYGKYASQKDSKFDSYYKECRDKGIPAGAYWFSYAKTESEARQEAKACLEVIKGKSFEYPIYFDVEGKALTTRAAVTACCKAFCSELESAGYFAGVYISRSPAETYLDSSVTDRYAMWIAYYNKTCKFSGSYGMWQYSSTGKLGGISGNVDLDVCYKDYPSIIKKAGLNNCASGGSSESSDKKKNLYNVKIIYKNGMNVRTGAGISYPIVKGVLAEYGKIYGITEERTVNGQKWGRLQSGVGWICIAPQFAEKV